MGLGIIEDYFEASEPPITTEAIFKRIAGRWTYATSSSAGGLAYDLPIPIPVQIELRLRTAVSYNALGRRPYLRDSSKRFKYRPHGIKLELPAALVRLVSVGHWTYWPINRAAIAKGTGTSRYVDYRGHVFRKRVSIELKGYERCDGRWIFREVNFYPVGHPPVYTDVMLGCHGKAVKHVEKGRRRTR